MLQIVLIVLLLLAVLLAQLIILILINQILAYQMFVIVDSTLIVNYCLVKAVKLDALAVHPQQIVQLAKLAIILQIMFVHLAWLIAYSVQQQIHALNAKINLLYIIMLVYMLSVFMIISLIHKLDNVKIAHLLVQPVHLLLLVKLV